MNVIVESLMVSYQRTGAGRPILFLHGWGDSGKTFDAIVNKMSSDYELITLDLPGFGGTQRPTDAWGLGEYARFVAAFLEKIDIERPYAIVGHSNGGAVAIKGLANHLLQTSKLILVASAGIRSQDGGKRTAWKLVAKTGKAVTSVLPSTTREKMRQKLYGGIGSDYLLVPEMAETFKKVVEEDIQSSARLLDTPTLLVYGTKDEATPVQYGEIFSSEIAKSKLYPIEGAGHFVHQEKTDEVTSLIMEFLA